ncbi:hypothetical protein BDF20DRAFT_853270 [Mycotypha africana]|uniref:uncharacterized protein n=1 Tax=Mycotypha africana TaxID=64632 RepID=UPI0022FFFC73|nr:uncharacterized protein BDF20DRAFT_853270 [Mycotypha africana]KAI8987992.1 hypothetical protein BDF20DRAFT_853270 [Mycotypha africana]
MPSPAAASEKQLNVAVIGSGLAGLTAAYLLEKNNHEHQQIHVHLFEKSSTLGMDAASVSVGHEKKKFRIDVPMRSFMSGYYSHLFRLYKHLEIPAKEAKFDFGWYRIKKYHAFKQTLEGETQAATATDRETKNESYLVYSGARTVGHFDLISSSRSPSLATLLLDLLKYMWRSFVVAYSYLWLMCIALWMQYRGHFKNPEHPICNMTLGQFFIKYRIHPYFSHQVFVPLFAAVCTSTYSSMLNYPASEILEYMAMGLNQASYVCAGGVQQVVRAMSAPLKHVHLATEITSIQANPDPNHRFLLIDQHHNTYPIDHIIFATQGNQSLRLLEGLVDVLRQQQPPPPPQQQQTATSVAIEPVLEQINMLKTFVYNTALVINHTDTRVLPSNPSHWKALNLAMVDKTVKTHTMDKRLIVPFPHETTMATHILNYTHPTPLSLPAARQAQEDKESEGLLMQTTNPCVAVDPSKVLSIAWFERATVTLESKKALQKLFTFAPSPTKRETSSEDDEDVQLAACQGNQGLWFVGSYCWRGIPLLEGCVASAEYVVKKGLASCEQLNIHVPWSKDKQEALEKHLIDSLHKKKD